MTRVIAIGLLAMVLAGCGSSAAPAAPSSGSTRVPVSSGPSERPSAAIASAAPTSTPGPTAAALSLLGPAPTAALDAETAARLQAVVDGAVADGAPDMIAAVLTADGTWAGAAGVDGPDGRKAEPTDEFGIASVSKVILAALILKLADQGKLDLDASIANYLDGAAIDANDATVRQALAMRSGIGTTPDGVIEKALAECDRPWTTDDVLGTVPDPFAEAGTRYEYSNPTYKLVGVAAETAAGMKLGDALESLVLDGVDSDRILLQGPHAAPPKPWALPLDGHGSGLDLSQFGVGGNLPCPGFTTLAWGASRYRQRRADTRPVGMGPLRRRRHLPPESLQAMTTVDHGWSRARDRPVPALPPRGRLRPRGQPGRVRGTADDPPRAPGRRRRVHQRRSGRPVLAPAC